MWERIIYWFYVCFNIDEFEWKYIKGANNILTIKFLSVVA